MYVICFTFTASLILMDCKLRVIFSVRMFLTDVKTVK